MSIVWYFVALVVLIALSAFFSASEMSYSSANRLRLENAAEDGSRRAKTAVGILDHFDRTLSAILIGNNLVNIAASSLGSVIVILLAGEQWTWVSTVVLTLLVIIFGETMPKIVAKQNANGKRYSHSGKAHDERDLRAHKHTREDIAALDVGSEPMRSRGALHGFSKVLLIGIVGQDARNELGHNRNQRKEQDEDGRHKGRLVRDDAVKHVFPDALALFDRLLGLAVRHFACSALCCQNGFFAHAYHPSSFAPYLIRGSSHA